MKNELPDAVGGGDGMSDRLCGCHILEDLEKRFSVPGSAVKGAAQFVGDAGRFGHGQVSGLRSQVSGLRET
jgi:hypothetical protein